MKTLSFLNNGRYHKIPVIIDYNKHTTEPIKDSRISIDSIYIAPEDLEVRYKKGNSEVIKKAEKGDIIVTFYDEDWIESPVAIVKNTDWKKNVLAYIKKKEAENNDNLIEAKYSCCDACEKCSC